MLSNLNIISGGRSLLTWMVKVWKWSERVIELSGDPNYRLAIMQMLLQRDHSASAARELRRWAERRHKNLSFIIVFNYLHNDRAGIPAAHWGPLCKLISGGYAGQGLYFCFLADIQLNFAFMLMPFFPLFSLSLLAIFPAPLNVSNRCSLTWRCQGLAIQLQSLTPPVQP